VVTGDVPEGTVVAGAPARVLRKIEWRRKGS
jgi:acetyltransferase-like isoleucine patch superfamily enzyme